MMDFSSINNVINRIEDIEYMVGMKRRAGGDASFQSMLDSELKAKNGRTSSPKNSRGSSDAQGASNSAQSAASHSNGINDNNKVQTNAFPDYARTARMTMPNINSSRVPFDANASYGSPAGQSQPSGASRDSVYADAINSAAQQYNLDPRLVAAVAEVESGFNQDAVSGAGAVGVMQLMPNTADALGVNPYDAEQNIEGGAHYIRQMLDAFGGDLRKAIAAYNAGPQAVRDYGGVPPYGETQDYVDSVLDLYR